jgi:large subunit ribosomal protein L30
MAKIRVTWVKSTIASPETQRRTIKSLGLHRLNHSVVHEDTLSVRGMINKVRHLVRVEEEVAQTK